MKRAQQECPKCNALFVGEMIWPDDIFPDGPKMCCSGADCMCRGLPVDFPWFQCPACGHHFEWSPEAAERQVLERWNSMAEEVRRLMEESEPATAEAAEDGLSR